jgi:hypothetical protein
MPVQTRTATDARAAPGVIPDHRGNPPQPPFLLFVEPSPEIGAIKSAESTVRQGGGPMSMTRRLIIALGVGGGILVLIASLALLDHDRAEANAIQLLAYFLAIVGFLVALFLTRFRATCTYVGMNGVERIKVKRSLTNTPSKDRLLFSNASELHAAQTRQFINGVSPGTIYDYWWNDINRKRLLRLNDTYRGNKKPPKPGSPFHFAFAAEVAWSIHYLERAAEHLKTEGSIPFRVDNKRWVRVGPGFLEFHFGGQAVRVTREEIAKVTLGGGRFAFKHKDAKWFSSEGNTTSSMERWPTPKCSSWRSTG